jgi:hypothetical protein
LSFVFTIARDYRTPNISLFPFIHCFATALQSLRLPSGSAAALHQLSNRYASAHLKLLCCNQCLSIAFVEMTHTSHSPTDYAAALFKVAIAMQLHFSTVEGSLEW